MEPDEFEIYNLLLKVRDLRTISLASKSLNISPVTFRKTIKFYEKKNKNSLLITSSGGINGGETRLTQCAYRIINFYEKKERSKLT